MLAKYQAKLQGFIPGVQEADVTGPFHQPFQSCAEYVWGKVHNVQNVQKRTESYRKYG